MPVTIPRFGRADVTVKYNCGSQEDFTMEVPLYTDVPHQPIIVLTIKGTVRQEAESDKERSASAADG